MVLVESCGVAALKSGDHGNPLLARCDNRLAPVDPSVGASFVGGPIHLLGFCAFTRLEQGSQTQKGLHLK